VLRRASVYRGVMHELHITCMCQLHNSVTVWVHVCETVCVQGLYVWQVSAACVKYMNYPVNTRTVQHSAQAMDFPAVTFCNMNPMRATAADTVPELRKLFDVSPEIYISSNTYLWSRNRSVTSSCGVCPKMTS